MKKISKVWLSAGAIIIIAILVWLFSGGKEEKQTSFSFDKASPANIQIGVTATGTIEPVSSVTVGTQVSGIVSKIYVDYNSEVKRVE